MKNKKWKKDIGYDQLGDNLFRNIIIDENGESFPAHVFGKTLEECEERSNIIASSPEFYEVIKKMKEILQKEWPKQEWDDFSFEIGLIQLEQKLKIKF